MHKLLRYFSVLVFVLLWPITAQCDPITASGALAWWATLAITAATTAASIGLQMLEAKKRKGQNIDRGKQDDIRASVPGYGEFIPWGRGTFRVAPIWIWESPAVDHPITTTVGGGGKFPKPPSNTTTDHAYFKSVAGVFHDGQIYGGVRRIWFDNDLVADFRIVNLSAVKYEAELGILSGGASVSLQAECSGGKKVTGIGSGGKCQMTVTTLSDDYELAVHYTSSTDMTYKVYVDGSLLGDLFCPASGGASTVAIATYPDPIPFLADDHLIRLENSGAACPALDCIDLAIAQLPQAESRQFASTVDLTKVAPENQNHSWAYNNFQPDIGDGVGAGGAAGTPLQTFNLAKYGQPSIRIYNGSSTQNPDSAIVAQEGVDFASALRGFAYIVIDQIQLPNGRMPNVTLEVDQGTHSVPVMVQDIYERVGVARTLVEVEALAGLSLGDVDIDAGTYAAVTYANTANVTTGSGGAIHKTSGANHAWNAYAAGNDDIASNVNGAIRFTADQGPILVGMGTDSSPTVTTDVKCGIILNTTSNPSLETKNAIQFWNGTTQGPDIGVWATGDLFQFEIRNGRFRVYQNGVEIQGFTPSVPAYPLFPQIMMYDTNAGVSALTVSTSGLIGDAPNADAGGLLQTSRMPAGELLNALQTRFQFDMIEIDEVVRAILRNRTGSDITIPYTDMRAVEVQSGSQPELPATDCEIADIDPYLLPDRVDVNYLDPSLDYHNNVQSWSSGVDNRYDEQSVSLPIIDSPDNMKALSTTLGHKAEMEGRSFAFQTGWKYMHVAPGAIATLSLRDSTHVARVVQAKYPLPVGVCEFSAVRQAASLYSPTASGSTSGYEPPIAAVPQNTQAIILDGPLFRSEDAGAGIDPVIYVGMCGRGAGTWSGGFMHAESPINSDNYEFVTSTNLASQIGVTEGVLASVADPSVWDRTSSLIVNFYAPTELSGVTESELLANPELNLIAVKNPSTGEVECLQFKTAAAGVPSAPYLSRYTVSTFLRGRCATIGNVGDHTSADQVVVIDASIKPRRQQLIDIGRTLKFKFQSVGQSLEDVIVTEETLYGWTVKPLAPSNLRGERDSDNNLLAIWNRRSRLAPGMIPNADVPLGEEREEYVFRVYDGVTIVRQWSVITGMGLAALLESSGANKFTDITVNTLAMSATGNTRARSIQQITQTGNYAEATLKSSGTGVAGFGLIASLGDWKGGTWAKDQADYYAELETNTGPGFTLKFFVAGVEVYSETETNAINIAGIRVRITLSGSEVRFTKDWSGAGTPAQYVSPVQPTFPLKVIAQVQTPIGGDHNVERVVMTITPQPATIYTAAQMTEDGLTPGDLIDCEVAQVSALTGAGDFGGGAI